MEASCLTVKSLHTVTEYRLVLTFFSEAVVFRGSHFAEDDLATLVGQPRGATGFYCASRRTGTALMMKYNGYVAQLAQMRESRSSFSPANATIETMVVDYAVAATGYKALTDRLLFLDNGLRSAIRTAEGAPVLVFISIMVSRAHLMCVSSMTTPRCRPMLCKVRSSTGVIPTPLYWFYRRGRSWLLNDPPRRHR